MSDNVISLLLDTPCNSEQARVFAAAKAEIERLRAEVARLTPKPRGRCTPVMTRFVLSVGTRGPNAN